jgi:hypothetical protein
MWTNDSGNWSSTTSSFSTLPLSFITSPAQGASITPLQAKISWNAVPGVSSYALWVGTSPGAKDALYFATPSATSTTVNLQPGTTYYATLWTNAGGTWFNTKSSFQTSAMAYLKTPIQGSTVFSQVSFSWTGVPSATAYSLWVGTSPGGKDALYFASPTATSTTASLQPGTTYYATLWTDAGGTWFNATSSFQTSAVAYLKTPVQGSTVSPQVSFSWAGVPSATAYSLWVGTSPGAKDALYFATPSATSTTVNLQPGTTYYATLWTNAGGTWFNTTSSFQTSAMAYLKTPIQGSTVFPPQVSFSWTGVPSATAYTLWVGTSPGTSNAAYLTASGTSTSIALLPGTTFYTTLWTNNSGSWSYTTSSFQTSQTAVLTSPSNGATGLDAGAPIAFNWTSISGVTEYQLDIGSSVGAKDAYSTRGTTSTSASAMLQPNTTYYARIWTDTAGAWSHVDSIFATGNALAHLSYPQDGATGVDLYLPFTWNQSSAANGYLLRVSPTGYGVNDFFKGQNHFIPTVTSAYVWALQPNTLYYAQLCTGITGAPGGGTCVNSQFTTGDAPAPPADASTFYQQIQSLTGQVRLMADKSTGVPTPGSYLYQFIASHNGDPTQKALCGWFAGTLLDQFNMNRITARMRNISLDGWDGHVITEYWDPFNEKWSIADPTFGAVYFDPVNMIGQSAEDVSSLVQALNFDAADVLFVTSDNSYYMTSYYLDPLIMYNNIDPFGMIDGNTELNYIPNSPTPLLTDVTANAVSQPWQPFIFRFVNSTDQVQILNGDGNTLTIVPENSEGWAPSVELYRWSFLSPLPSGMQVFTMNRYRF